MEYGAGYLLGQGHVALGCNGIDSVLVSYLSLRTGEVWIKKKENYTQKRVILRMVQLAKVTNSFSHTLRDKVFICLADGASFECLAMLHNMGVYVHS